MAVETSSIPPDDKTTVIDVEAVEVPTDPEAVGNDIGEFFDSLGSFARQGGRVVKKLSTLGKKLEGSGLVQKVEAVVGPLSRPMPTVKDK